MSTTITQSELQKMPKRPEKLTRSHSLDTIRKFCSPNYFFLPSLLLWLRNSHTVIQSSTEKTLFYFRSLLLNSCAYKTTESAVRNHPYVRYFKDEAPRVAQRQLLVTLDAFAELCGRLRRIVFRLVVYCAVGVVLMQLVFCLYLLSVVLIPVGLGFLVVCLYSICHMKCKVDFFYMRKQQAVFLEERRKVRTDDALIRPKKRSVFGERTISNLNLF